MDENSCLKVNRVKAPNLLLIYGQNWQFLNIPWHVIFNNESVVKKYKEIKCKVVMKQIVTHIFLAVNRLDVHL